MRARRLPGRMTRDCHRFRAVAVANRRCSCVLAQWRDASCAPSLREELAHPSRPHPPTTVEPVTPAKRPARRRGRGVLHRSSMWTDSHAPLSVNTAAPMVAAVLRLAGARVVILCGCGRRPPSPAARHPSRRGGMSRAPHTTMDPRVLPRFSLLSLPPPPISSLLPPPAPPPSSLSSHILADTPTDSAASRSPPSCRLTVARGVDAPRGRRVRRVATERRVRASSPLFRLLFRARSTCPATRPPCICPPFGVVRSHSTPPSLSILFLLRPYLVSDARDLFFRVIDIMEARGNGPEYPKQCVVFLDFFYSHNVLREYLAFVSYACGLRVCGGPGYGGRDADAEVSSVTGIPMARSTGLVETMRSLTLLGERMGGASRGTRQDGGPARKVAGFLEMTQSGGVGRVSSLRGCGAVLAVVVVVLLAAGVDVPTGRYYAGEAAWLEK
ncbi:hypothetical protein C8J57DRAFT_1679353 [Mycena rebaudengoi]|nr:hypothetical protein C8J57DRAFT_1679353 [Mycena rebaudengoi]